MKGFVRFSGILMAACLLFVAGCKKDDGDDKKDNTGLDRRPMLVNYANNYIVPAYAKMTTDLTTLKAKTDNFVQNANEANLTELQEAYKAAYLTWQKVDMLEFGPAEDVSLRMYMNTYPVTLSKLNNNIISGSYDLEEFGNKDAQGFPALDYMLNGIAPDAAAIVSNYTTETNAAQRKLYLQAVVNKMLQKTEGVKNSWDNYKATFTESTGTDVSSSLSKMVNSFVLYYERYLRSGKIGLPVGAMTGVAKPEITEAYYSPALSKQLALEALKSVKAFYEGKSFDGNIQAECMKSYLGALGTKDETDKLMADVISTELDEAIAALQNINTPIKTAVQNNRPAVLTLYDELQEIVPLLKVDMVSAFGISITYTDNDGD